MILELDCGNSYIKWRVLDPASALVMAQGVTGVLEQLLDQLGALAMTPSRCRLVSVRSEEETLEVCGRVAGSLGIAVTCAAPSQSLGGVTNGYLNYTRLGLDRWLASVGAYSMCQRACLIVDLGTAVTLDLVDADGRHLGGYISPGMQLLRSQLQAHTRRIRYDLTDAMEALSDTAPGKDTAAAAERGCLLMLRGYLEAQIKASPAYLGADFDIFATGGDALLVSDIAGVQCVPDLVFRGLAIACP